MVSCGYVSAPQSQAYLKTATDRVVVSSIGSALVV